jgi:hypothetical protein
MSEMPYAGKHHDKRVLIGCPDDLFVAQAAPGLDHGSRACLSDGIDAVAKREERIRCDHGAG